LEDINVSDYRDNLTLDEIGANDIEMTKDAIKNANKYEFGNNKKKAADFTKHCMKCTLNHLGVSPGVPPKDQLGRLRFAKRADQMMKKAGVVIEQRKDYDGNDMWRRGIYIYKNGELAAFISNIFADVKESYSKETLKLVGRSNGFFVITNARTDNIDRVYGPRKANVLQG
jgi:hypothetical protein